MVFRREWLVEKIPQEGDVAEIFKEFLREGKRVWGDGEDVEHQYNLLGRGRSSSSQ